MHHAIDGSHQNTQSFVVLMLWRVDDGVRANGCHGDESEV